MSSINANSMRIGDIIEHKDNLWKVITTDHVKPGKGGAFIQTTLKNIKTNSKLNERFRSSESITKASGETIKAVFLFMDNDTIEVADRESFAQFSIDKSIISPDKINYLTDNMEISVSMIQEQIIDIILPDTVICKIEDTQPFLKGQTVTSTPKPALLDNGITITVPQFIEIGDEIIVKTADNAYMERKK